MSARGSIRASNAAVAAHWNQRKAAARPAARQFDYDEILNSYRDQQKKANQANEERYGQQLKLANRNIRQAKRYGKSQRQEIADQADRSQAQGTQDLISRGLGNTTITESVRRGVGADADRSNLLLDDLVGQRVSSARSAKSDIIGGRSDVGPNLDAFSQLLQQMGQGQAMAGAGGGGGLVTMGNPNYQRPRSPVSSGGRASSARVVYGARGNQDPSGRPGQPGETRGPGGSFDDMFLGGDVFRGGDIIGRYAGQGGVDQVDDLDLMNQRGELDFDRLDPNYRR